MKTSNIIMEPSEAMEKILACNHKTHADSQEFNKACMEAYALLAKGHKLLHLSLSIQKAGLCDCGRPKLASTTADR